MSNLPIVAIIGRPNVGKSSLFNRIVRKRAAVVEDTPGLTRDRHYVDAIWNNVSFTAVDTGGLIPRETKGMAALVNQQVAMVLEEAAVIVFVAEYTTGGPTDVDLQIARNLRKKAFDRVILGVNKTEGKNARYDSGPFINLGLGEPIMLSALHGYGVSDLLEEVVDRIKKSGSRVKPKFENFDLRLAIIGRPNAGKSSLVNKLLGTDRMIVDEAAGTTRDSIDTPVNYQGKHVALIDTAGLREKSRVTTDIEYYCNMRALAAIERADVAIVMIDASKGIAGQDLKILVHVNAARKGAVICLNKWDLVEKDHKTFDHMVSDIKNTYTELHHLAVVSLSAKSGQRVNNVVDMAFAVHERMSKRVSAAQLRDETTKWFRANPHPVIKQKPVKFLGARQLVAAFPYFRFIVNNAPLVTEGYKRYLINKIQDTFDFTGCPIIFDFRTPGKGTPESATRTARIT